MQRFKSLAASFLVVAPLLLFEGPQPVFTQPGDLESLAEDLKNGTVEIKRDTLQELQRLKSEKASRVAAEGLADESEIVRATAIGAVVYLPEAEAAAAVLPFLSSRSPFIRKEAAFALGEIGNEAAVGPLILSLEKDRSTEVRGASAVALGLIGDPQAIGPLSRVLRKKPKTSIEFLRRSAARALGQIAEKQAKRPISLSTPDSFLPNNLKTVLAPAQEKPVVADVGAIVGELESVLRSEKESNDTKREAAFALGAIGDDRAMATLQRLANSKDYYLAEICREALLRISAN